MPRRDEHIRYYPNFRWVIPNFEAGYQCVTLPFAMGLNPFDLHALDTPPAFILSQDQTLIKDDSYVQYELGFMQLDYD